MATRDTEFPRNFVKPAGHTLIAFVSRLHDAPTITLTEALTAEFVISESSVITRQ